MCTTAHEIASHIERTRGELGSNIDELERKVKSVADWEYQFQARPMALIGLAFGSGVILASILAGGKRSGGARRLIPLFSSNSKFSSLAPEASAASLPWTG